MCDQDAMLNVLVSDMPSNPDGLLRALIARLDGSMLQEIAAADYGDRTSAHLRALRRICETHRVDEMAWEPHEVLSLIRWSQPEDPKWGPGGHGERGHIMRAFCCCALLHVSDYGEAGENTSVAPLVESAHILDGELPSLLRNFLVWRLREQPPEDEERLFFVLGLLLLAARDGATAPGWFDRTIYWIDLEESRLRQDEFGPVDERWVWGITCFNTSHDIWLRLIRTILLEHAMPQLRLFGQRLLDEHARKRRIRGK